MLKFQILSILAAVCLISVNAQAESKGFSCGGTEPFYNLVINGNVVTLDYVGDKPLSYRVSGPTPAEGMQSSWMSVYKAPAKKAVITVLTGECSDGMSDETYSHHLIYTQGSRVLYGCCLPLE